MEIEVATVYGAKLRTLIKNYGGHKKVVEEFNRLGEDSLSVNNLAQLLLRTERDGKGFFLSKNSSRLERLLQVLGTNKKAFFDSSELYVEMEEIAHFDELKPKLNNVIRILGKQNEQISMIQKSLPKTRTRSIQFPVKITEILWPFLNLYTDFGKELFEKPAQKDLLDRMGKRLSSLYNKDKKAFIQFPNGFSVPILKEGYPQVEDLRFKSFIDCYWRETFNEINSVDLSNLYYINIPFFLTSKEYDQTILKLDFFGMKDSDNNFDIHKQQMALFFRYYNPKFNYFKELKKRSHYSFNHFKKNRENGIKSFYDYLGKPCQTFEEYNEVFSGRDIDKEIPSSPMQWLELYFIWFLLRNMLVSYKGYVNRMYRGENQVESVIYDCFKNNQDSLKTILKFIIKDHECYEKYLISEKSMKRLIAESIEIGILVFVEGFTEESDTGYENGQFLDINRHRNDIVVLTNKISNLCDYISIQYDPKSIGL